SGSADATIHSTFHINSNSSSGSIFNGYRTPSAAITANAPSRAWITDPSSALAGGVRISGQIVSPSPTAISAYIARSSHSRRVEMPVAMHVPRVVVDPDGG